MKRRKRKEKARIAAAEEKQKAEDAVRYEEEARKIDVFLVGLSNADWEALEQTALDAAVPFIRQLFTRTVQGGDPLGIDRYGSTRSSGQATSGLSRVDECKDLEKQGDPPIMQPANSGAAWHSRKVSRSEPEINESR